MSSGTSSGSSSALYRRPRQEDIARMAGISQSAVSLILNGKHVDRIHEETRQRVLEIAASLGYQPNSAARRLQGQQSRQLGVHSSGDIFPIGFQHYSYEYLVGIYSAAEQTGYDMVLLTSTRRGSVPSPYVGSGENLLGSVDGAILVGGHASDDDLTRLVNEAYPFVHIGRRDVAGITVPSVGADYVAGVARLVQELARSGHQRLVYVGLDSADEIRADKRAGYRKGIARAQLTEQYQLLPRESVTADWLTGLDARGGVTVIAEDPDFAHRCVGAATAIGLRLRSDIAIAVLSAPLTGEFDSWYCGFLIEPREAIGWRAGRTLVDMIEGRTKRAQELLLPCRPAVTTYGFVPS